MRRNIKVCSIKQDFYDMFDSSVELEANDKRPCLIVLKLKYRGKKYDFAIPFRSNIYKYADRAEYYPLPPRATTRVNRKHGLHYIKMFPVTREYVRKYYQENTENRADWNKIEKNFKDIINEAQKYLENYEKGTRFNYCVDIDKVIEQLYPINTIEQIEPKEIEQQVLQTTK